jgi:hypothetical protein
MRRWHEWWRVANREQLICFLFIGGAALLVFMTLTFVTVGSGVEATNDLSFIRSQGDQLAADRGSWLATAFWLVGTMVLFSTNLTVLDMVGRITADVLKTGRLKDTDTWSESRIYFTVVWRMIIIRSTILLSGLDQPLLLLVIASSLNGLVMFVYSVLLIRLNRGVLPREIGVSGVRLGALVWAVLFYGFFSAILLWDQLGSLL